MNPHRCKLEPGTVPPVESEPQAGSRGAADRRVRARHRGSWSKVMFASDLVQVGALRQYPESPGWRGEHDTGPGISIGFPQKPMEYQRDDHGWVVGCPNTAFLNDPHSRYQRRRIDAKGEYTEWMRFDLGAAREVIREYDPTAADEPQRIARTSLTMRSPDVFQAQQLLHSYVQDPTSVDSIFVEEVAFWILEQTVRSSLPGSLVRARTARASTEKAHRTVAFDAIRYIVRNFREPMDAAAVAQAAHVSRPTLFRAFRAHTGLTVHRYLTSLRLRQAYLRLGDDGVTLADLAADLGFSSHAHLTVVFQREFGAPPSTVRAGLGFSAVSPGLLDLRRSEIEAILAAHGLPSTAD